MLGFAVLNTEGRQSQDSYTNYMRLLKNVD